MPKKDLIDANEQDDNNNQRVVEHKNMFLNVMVDCNPNGYDALPLRLSLPEYMDDQQLLKIGRIKWKKQQLIIKDRQIIDSFRFYKEGEQCPSQCACGVYISKEYFVQNKESGKLVTIGSKCIERFYSQQWELHKEQEAEKNKPRNKSKSLSYFCVDCEEKEVEGYSCVCSDCD